MSMQCRAALLAATMLMLNCAAWMSSRSGSATGGNPAAVIRQYSSIDTFTAFGTVSATSGGVTASGSIEVHYAGSNSARMVLYSPLGTIVGSMTARNDSLAIEYDDHLQVMALADPFSSELLPWGSAFRCYEVIQAISGRMIYGDSLINRQPTEIIHSGRRICYIWESPGWSYSVYVTRRRGRLKKIEFKKKDHGSISHHLSFSSFTADGARMIMMKVDDRNYFSIHYEQFLHK